MGRAEARDLDLFGGTLFEPGFSRKAMPGPVSPRIDSAPAPGARIEFTPAPAEQPLDYTARSPAIYRAMDEAPSPDAGASKPLSAPLHPSEHAPKCGKRRRGLDAAP